MTDPPTDRWRAGRVLLILYLNMCGRACSRRVAALHDSGGAAGKGTNCPSQKGGREGMSEITPESLESFFFHAYFLFFLRSSTASLLFFSLSTHEILSERARPSPEYVEMRRSSLPFYYSALPQNFNCCHCYFVESSPGAEVFFFPFSLSLSLSFFLSSRSSFLGAPRTD